MTTKINSRILQTIHLLIAVGIFGIPAQAKYGGGDGTAEDPYLIYTAEQMNTIGTETNDLDKHFKLMADLDLSIFKEKGFNTIGTVVYNTHYPFTGTFDGNNHTLSNFSYTSPNSHNPYIGFFGYVKGAEIKNLGLIDPNIDVHSEHRIGSLVSYLNNAMITNCYVQGGKVTGGYDVGGLVGYNEDSIIADCRVEGISISGISGVGGLAGRNTYSSIITNCYSSGIVSAEDEVGGVVGFSNGTIVNSHSSHHVLGTGQKIGGLVGLSYGEISNCYADGEVYGDTEVGGLVGQNEDSIIDCGASGSVQGLSKAGGLVGLNSGWLISCCSTGSVSGGEKIGGLIGQNGLQLGCIVFSGVLYNCYSTSSVTGQNYIGGLVGADEEGGWFFDCFAAGSVSGNENIGGFAGLSNKGKFSNSFWDTQTTGQLSSAGGIGKATIQMYDPNTFMDVGWDFVDKPDGPHDIWAEPSGGGYPILWWQLTPLPELPTFSWGTGDPNDPYLIATADELNSIGYNPRLMDAHFKLINDIDLTGVSFFIIGKGEFPFTAVFDGNNKKISNFSYNSTDTNSIGLFGSVRGEIKNLGLIDPNVNAGTGNYIGSLAASCNSIFNCYVQGGNISGGEYVGGLVGGNASISNCYTEGTSVSGNKYVGGLVGANYTIITNCYSINRVSGDSFVGGLAGMTKGITMNCYSAGKVTGTTETGGLVGNNRGIVRGSYWDIEASGQSSSAGGTGKTTYEMQLASTFVGWGYDLFWTIDNGGDYPRLFWQNVPGETIPNTTYGGGSGTEEDPYLIYTAEQFNWISLIPGDWDKHFKLMADIDFNELAGASYSTIGYYSIPNHIKPFSGVFDGNGHTISNFIYNTKYIHYIGLFSIVDGENAQIKNLGLIAPNISAKTERTGAIVGWMKSGYINNCHTIDGNIAGKFVVGGFIGSNGGIINNSYVISTTSGTQFVGGFSGINTGTISNCYANSSDTNLTTASGWSGFGGLVGQNDGLVTNCYAIGNTSVTMGHIGGLVGRNHDSIVNCYAISDVSGKGDIGGLIGLNSGSITNCYSVGNVTGTDNIGGLVGQGRYGEVINSIWDIETSGQIISAGGIGRTTAEMQTATTFLEAGWDFVGETENGTEDIWWILEGRDYPRLWWEIGDESSP